MKAITQTITGWIGDFKDLDDVIKEMFYIAKAVRKNAQAEFSHYLVGATVQSAKTSNIYRGCNVERASYTQTSHAEQVAIDSMIAAEGKGAKLDKLVLIAGSEYVNIVIPPVVVKKREFWEVKFSEIPAPCGHCLQIIWENCLKDDGVQLYGFTNNGEVTMVTINSAFPFKFGPADLGVVYGK